MNKNGEILIVDDDQDDHDVLADIFKELNYSNEIRYFFNGFDLLDYLRQPTTKPFLILSDINMPKIDGFDLRSQIFQNEELRTKCIPYLFFTTHANDQFVKDAYTMSVQGFFQKPNSYNELKNTIFKIMEYWKECYAP